VTARRARQGAKAFRRERPHDPNLAPAGLEQAAVATASVSQCVVARAQVGLRGTALTLTL
jgi:hypothetical protein